MSFDQTASAPSLRAAVINAVCSWCQPESARLQPTISAASPSLKPLSEWSRGRRRCLQQTALVQPPCPPSHPQARSLSHVTRRSCCHKLLSQLNGAVIRHTGKHAGLLSTCVESPRTSRTYFSKYFRLIIGTIVANEPFGTGMPSSIAAARSPAQRANATRA